MSSKRCRKPPPTLQEFPSLQLHHRKKTWIGRHGKTRKLILGDKQTTTCDRKWEEMDHEILIYILKRYKWYEWGYIDFVVCKTWLSAFLDALFPPGDVLDLRLLDEHVNFADTDGGEWWSGYTTEIRKFLHYLKLNLDRHSPNHYTKLILSECILHANVYSGLAQRLPSLKSFVSPGKMSSYADTHLKCVSSTESYFYVSYGLFRHWRYLEEVHCHHSMLRDLALFSKSVRNLTLVGLSDYRHWLPDNEAASIIATGFPLLDHLGISGFVFSFTGISMILDSHKNLSYLDMTHTFLVPDQVMLKRWRYLIPLDYPLPKDVSHKLASVSTLLTCSRKNCSKCIYFDSRYDSITRRPKSLPPLNR